MISPHRPALPAFIAFTAGAFALPLLLPGQTIPRPHLTLEVHGEAHTRDDFRKVEGDVFSTRIGSSLQYWQPLGPAFFGTLTSRVDFFQYDFGGNPADGAFFLEDATRLMLQLELNQFPRERFGYFLFLQLSEASGSEGSLGKGLTGFGTFGLSYKVAEPLIAGLGVAYGGNILRDPSVFPVPFLFWQINEQWRLTSRNGVILTRTSGPLTLAGEVLYLNRQIALGATDGQPRGALEDSGVRAGLKTTWRTEQHWRFEAGVFSYVWREIKVRREDRTEVFREGVEPGLSAEFALSKRF